MTDFEAAYWRYRLDYDRAALDLTAYWQRVAADLGRSYTGAEIAELSRLDAASWLTLQPGTVDLIMGLAAAGQRLAVLSNARADVAEAVGRLPMAGYFEHLVFSCALKSAKPAPECFRATLALLEAGPRGCHLPGRPARERRRGGRPRHQECPIHRRPRHPRRPGPVQHRAGQ